MKTKERPPDPVQVKKLERFDEDMIVNGKKASPLDVEFTEPPKPDTPPTVGFLELYRFASSSERWLLLLGILGAVGSAACSPLNVLLFGDLTGVMVTYGVRVAIAVNTSTEVSQEDTDEFLAGISSFAVKNAVIGAIMLIATYVSIAIFNYIGHSMIFRIRALYFKSALEQDIGWYDVNQSGDLASRMSEDMTKLEDGVGEKVSMFLHMMLSFVGSVILALVKGWELALICLISLPVTMISMGLVAFASAKLAKKELLAYGKAGAIAEEVISSIRTVIAFAGYNKETERYETNLVAARDINIKRNMFNGLGFGILWFFIYSSYALAFWYGVGLIIRDMDLPEDQVVYDASTMTTVFFGVMMGSMQFGMASPFIDAFSVAKGAAAKVYAVIDRKSPIDSMSDDGERPLEVDGNITLSDVHFEYPSRKTVPILQGINLTIKRGETVALVGSSGCGKSTCIQLIQRFYDPREGSVQVDGRDIRSLNVGWLRSQIGVVGQEPVLFQTTVAENIRYGRDDCSMDDIVEAAKMANAHSFIVKLPQGYDTLVGERGAQISGGQKQRIAIARALVRKPKILLLDEATSALDTASEAKVQAALDRASVGRTTIIVAHRLSTIRNADKIVVLSGGKVVEEGSHDQLMALEGHYHGLVTAQLTSAVATPAAAEGKEHMLAQRMMSVRSEGSSVAAEDEEDSLSPAMQAAIEKYREEPVKPVSMFQVVKMNRPEYWLLVVGCVCAMVSGFAMPIFSVLFGNVLGALSANDAQTIRDETNYFSLLFVIMGVIIGFASFVQIYLLGIAGEKLTMRMRGIMFSSILRQEVAYFDDKNNSTGALCARLSTDAANIQAATGQRISSVVQSLATVVLAIGLAMYYEWRLGLLTLAFAPILFAAFFMQGRLNRGNLFGQAKSTERATKLAVEAVSNIRTVVGLSRERQFHAQYVVELTPSFMRAKTNLHLRAVVYGLSRSIAFFAYAAAMYYGGTLIANEGVPYETIFKVSQSLIMGTTMVANILSFTPNFQKGLEAAAKAFHLMKRKPRVDDPPNASNDMWESSGEVKYRDLEFAYPTRLTTLVLRGLDLDIKPGQTVALVGPSGCGKSTCVQLLERFYDPISGTVKLDERDISGVTMKSLRAQLGIVSQEPVLFDRTIAENIAYGDNTRNVSMQEIIEAAKKSNIHTFIVSLPQGYDTRLGEKGTQLSGGQKQRVAIARALVRNPRVLLLDEATSALDTESEKVVQEALDKAREGRTCITIAHRLTTIQDADVICVINEGRVAELGRHQELLAARGIYHKLHSLQAGGRK